MHLKYGQSFVHQNNLLTDIFVFTSTMRLRFCISDGDRQVSHGDIIMYVLNCSLVVLVLNYAPTGMSEITK